MSTPEELPIFLIDACITASQSYYKVITRIAASGNAY
jgi:hypothetical protein